jgi:ribosomal protein S18
MQSRYTSWRTERKWVGSLPCSVQRPHGVLASRARGAHSARQHLERFFNSGEAAQPADDINALKKFVSDRGKIRSRRITGACRRHQNQVARAVKRARELALLPYVGEGSGPDEGERGGRGGRGGRDR